MRDFASLCLAASAPLTAAVSVPASETNQFLVAAAGSALALLIAIRRSIATEAKREVGALNVLFSTGAGMGCGCWIAPELVGMSIRGIGNPFSLTPTTLLTAIFAGVALDVILDGTALRVAKSMIPKFGGTS